MAWQLLDVTGRSLSATQMYTLLRALDGVRELKLTGTVLPPVVICCILRLAGVSKNLKVLRWSGPIWRFQSVAPLTPVPQPPGIGVGLQFVKDQLVSLDLDLWLTSEYFGQMVYGPAGYLTNLRSLGALQSLSITLQGLWGSHSNFEKIFSEKEEADGDVEQSATFPDILPPNIQHLTLYNWFPPVVCGCGCAEIAAPGTWETSGQGLRRETCRKHTFKKAVNGMFRCLKETRRRDIGSARMQRLNHLNKVTWFYADTGNGACTDQWQDFWKNEFRMVNIDFDVRVGRLYALPDTAKNN